MADQTRSPRAVVLALLAGAALFGGVAFWVNRPEPAPPTAPAEATVAETVEGEADAAAAAEEVVEAAEAAGEAEDAVTEPSVDAPLVRAEDDLPPGPEPRLPGALPEFDPVIDVVRVEPSGETVVAGFAEPGSEIMILIDGEDFQSVTADASGNFIAFLDLGASEQGQTLEIEMVETGGERRQGTSDIILAPRTLIAEAETALPAPTVSSDASGDAPAATEETAADSANAPADEETAVAPAEDAPEAPPEIASTEQAIPPAVPDAIVSDAAGVRALASQRLTQNQIFLDAISYDEEGDVSLSGRGARSAGLQVYLNNQPIQLARIDGTGTWSVELPDVDPGTYILRVDQLDDAGQVSSRVETPFLREEPDVITSLPELAENGVNVVTVQTGNTLWGIARERYGEGLLYVQVFEANRDQIRDPDLIYPGQVFTIPELP